ncbi:ribose-5-phosphate isomerase RpiA [Paenibacillus sp. BSR1-1]|uniref:ribose-5-phosphate isomerase RpiA n=1 Tax=Paenibacillus sp. BSR1-1 TaxID=3020845 RepID=UPI0025B00443|nr:ribose-5-phosphate isomerase RpiA [Paenibacillus sp. BSR1-1]MDN3015485.1 ribose-5-phosphate isomerase RpiA [Paenibacillus sp. BSR1-1]
MKEKQLAGEEAVHYIKEGMTVGLGTGSTVYYSLMKLGELVKNGLKIKGVSTSKSTTALCEQLGIPLISINEVNRIDVTIDGVDEVDHKFNGIKGGGGALLFEKVVASISDKVIWVSDSSKVSQSIGHFPLPVEIVPFGYVHVLRTLENHNLNPQLRVKQNEIYKTDSGNYIVDLHLKEIENVEQLSSFLKNMTGVVEHGLFLNVVDTLIVGDHDRVNITIVK